MGTWLIAASSLSDGMATASAATATFEVRLAPTEADAVLRLDTPDDVVLDLELWVTLSGGALPPEGVLAYAVFLSPSADAIVQFNSGSFLNVLSPDPVFDGGEDNQPKSGDFGRSVGFLPPFTFAPGETKLATFSVTAVGEGVATYNFMHEPPAREWDFHFADDSSADLASGPVLAITVQSSTPSVQVSSWRSVRTHGAAGDLPIALDPAATGAGASGPTLETRQGGLQHVQVTFDLPVILVNPSGIMCSGRTTENGVVLDPVAFAPQAVSMSNSTHLEIVFDPASMPDRTCYTLSLSPDVISPGLTGDLDVQVRSLWGDLTGDGQVTLTDALAAGAAIGMPIAGRAAFDIDLSGDLAADDAVAIKSRVGSAAPTVFCADPASVIAWRSVRVHTAAGPLAIPLSAANQSPPAVESRMGGIERIEIDFDRPVTLNEPASVTIVGRTSLAGGGLAAPVDYAASSITMVDSDTAQIALSPGLLPDQTCYTIILAPDLVTAGLIGDRDASVRTLAGDVTGDGLIRLSDVLAIRARWSTTSVNNPGFDMDLSGGIDLEDLQTAKSRIASPPQRARCP